MSHTKETRARAYAKIKLRRKLWLLENGPCVICHSWDKLEVDHIDPSTKVSHNVWSWSEKKRTAELAKCQVLCRKHHEEKTAKENSERMGGLKHGTEAMYRKGKCRCEECLSFRRETKRAYRARKRNK